MRMVYLNPARKSKSLHQDHLQNLLLSTNLKMAITPLQYLAGRYLKVFSSGLM